MNSLLPPSTSRARRFGGTPAAERGSVLIVAMIFSAIMAVSIGTYATLGRTNLQMSNRALYNNAAINLAESGLEQAMWSINKMVEEDPDAWDDWDSDADGAWRRFSGFTFDQNSTGYVRVYVRNHTGVIAPRIVARSTVQLASGAPIEKWIRVDLMKRSLFANGLVAKNTIMFSGGNASVDSFDSRKGTYNQLLADGTYNRYANGSAGSGSVAVDSFSLGNADIWGYISIGTEDYSGLDVGPNGTVAGFSSAQGTIDYSRVTTDFKPNFDDMDAPTTTGYTIADITSSTTLPLGGHTPAADGKYYYSVSSVSLSGHYSRVLDVASGADVVLTVTTSSGTALNVSGNAAILVPTDATLAIYTSGDVSIEGNGIANSNEPAAFQLWSTKPNGSGSTQSVSISGNGELSAVIYAPNAAVSLNGGGSGGAVYGAVVADGISVTGGSKFHYDEALSDMTDGKPYGITTWKELTLATDRDAFRSALSF